jgi:DNA-binding CsgD family transcriptional regulator
MTVAQQVLLSPALLGRAAEQAVIGEALADGRIVVLTGWPGIGKSALLTAAADTAAVGGAAVLRGAPAEPDCRLAYVTLSDLLGGLDWQSAGSLTSRQRAALDAALARGGSVPGGSADGGSASGGSVPGGPASGGIDELALRLAVLAILDALAVGRPVVIALDDAQWIDPASADVLAFALHRLRDRRVAAVLAVTGQTRHCPVRVPGMVELPVRPLASDVLARLLEARLGRRATSAFAASIHAASGGNPGLALAAFDGASAHGIAGSTAAPPEIRALLQRHLDMLSGSARSALLCAALAAEPSVALLERAGQPDADRALREASEHGLVELGDEGAVRFVVGSLPKVLRSVMPHQDQRAVHARLAAAMSDPVQRLRHRVLATPAASAQIADSLDEAAGIARRRGARSLAAELSQLAAERTPPGQAEACVPRLVSAAEDAAAGGDLDRAGRVMRAVFARTDAPGPRVRTALAVIDASGQGMDELDELFARVLHNARGDPALLAEVHCRLATRASLVGALARARDHATKAAGLAASSDDHGVRVVALSMKARMQRMLGEPGYRQTLHAALAAQAPPGAVPPNCGPRFLRARFDVFDDRLDEARGELMTLLAGAEHDGGVEATVEVLRCLAELDVKAGRCAHALDYANRALRLSEEHGLSPGPACYSMSVAEAAGGSFGDAATYARRGAGASEHEHDRIYLSRNLYALGTAMVAADDVEGALAALLRVRGLEMAQGVIDPSTLCWHGELAAALARSGRADEAADTVSATRDLAMRLGRPGVIARLDRAMATVHVARDEPDAAAMLLQHAARRFAALGLPIEQGRTALLLGKVQRRLRRHAAARATLAEARRILERCHAVPWLPLVAREMLVLDGPRPDCRDASRLTAAELDLARLAACGASNREIAAQLFLSVKTVEATLTRTYRKLGIRSRAQLASGLARSPG